MIRPRTKPRRGQPTKAEKGIERERVYVRCEGTCELRNAEGKPLHRDHIEGVLPREGDVMWRWHLVHLRSKRRFGWTEASGNTLLGGCYPCHIIAMHQLGYKPEVHRGPA